MKLKFHRLNPSLETIAQYPEITVFDPILCRVTNKQDGGYWIAVGDYVAWVTPEELGNPVTLEVLTVKQRNVLTACLYGANYRQLQAAYYKDDYSGSGASRYADHMSIRNMIGLLLDKPFSKRVSTRSVTRRYFPEKYPNATHVHQRVKYDRDTKSMVVQTYCVLEVPYKQKGYLSRTGTRGKYVYTTTAKGREALATM